MHPIDQLDAEHAAIHQVLKELDRTLEAVEQERTSPDRLRPFAEFFLVWVDGLHHAKELLMLRSLRAMHGAAVMPRVSRMLSEHEHSAEAAALLLSEVDVLLAKEEAPGPYVTLFRRYVVEQRTHMAYEGSELYPLARATLMPAQVEALASRFGLLDRHGISPLLAARETWVRNR